MQASCSDAACAPFSRNLPWTEHPVADQSPENSWAEAWRRMAPMSKEQRCNSGNILPEPDTSHQGTSENPSTFSVPICIHDNGEAACAHRPRVGLRKAASALDCQDASGRSLSSWEFGAPLGTLVAAAEVRTLYRCLRWIGILASCGRNMHRFKGGAGTAHSNTACVLWLLNEALQAVFQWHSCPATGRTITHHQLTLRLEIGWLLYKHIIIPFLD